MASGALIDAIKAGDVERAREVVAENPDAASERDESGVSAPLLARYYGRDELAEELAARREELDLFEAAAFGRTERVRELLTNDPTAVAAFSSDGFTPLHLAVFFGQRDAARLLVEHSADVSVVARNEELRVRPIHSAAAGGGAELVTLLLERGADPNVPQEGGFTPLHAAGQHGDAEMIGALLRHGADAAARTDEGQTAADVARAAGHDPAALGLA